MTKRRDVIATIGEAARRAGLTWSKAREGANHTVYQLDGLKIPIARHGEIDNRMAEIIYKECQAKLGKGWWK
jgi:hypothetical protein